MPRLEGPQGPEPQPKAEKESPHSRAARASRAIHDRDPRAIKRAEGIFEMEGGFTGTTVQFHLQEDARNPGEITYRFQFSDIQAGRMVPGAKIIIAPDGTVQRDDMDTYQDVGKHVLDEQVGGREVLIDDSGQVVEERTAERVLHDNALDMVVTDIEGEVNTMGLNILNNKDVEDYLIFLKAGLLSRWPGSLIIPDQPDAEGAPTPTTIALARSAVAYFSGENAFLTSAWEVDGEHYTLETHLKREDPLYEPQKITLARTRPVDTGEDPQVDEWIFQKELIEHTGAAEEGIDVLTDPRHIEAMTERRRQLGLRTAGENPSSGSSELSVSSLQIDVPVDEGKQHGVFSLVEDESRTFTDVQPPFGTTDVTLIAGGEEFPLGDRQVEDWPDERDR